MVEMKPDMVEHIKSYPVRYGIGWIAILGVLAWLFQSWPGGFWDWLEIAWGWLRKTPNGYESVSTTIRNLGLFLAAPIALWLAIWRARVADRQSQTAQQSLVNERYQKGAEMLGSDVLSVRLGGIYALERLAREHPGEYHMQIIRLFCAFVRNPTEESREDIEKTKIETVEGMEERGEGKHKLPEDVREIARVIQERTNKQIEMEQQVEYRLDLYGANLVGADLGGANLCRASLVRAKLRNAFLGGADLTGALLFDSELDGEYLGLLDANLTNTDLSRVIGLTQRQLDTAIADPDNPPKLDGALDAETGEQLEWRGKPSQRIIFHPLTSG